MPRLGSGRDLTGLTFGRLTALDFIRRGNDRVWRCKCECGSEHWTVTGNLTSGDTKSCGCRPRQKETRPRRLKTHGEARHDGSMTRTYRIWRKMLARCRNHNQRGFDRYGGRGITVCSAWTNYEQFRNDMGECPPGMEIERIDNDGNYEPSNCRWATRKEQTRNTSTNRLLTLNGVTKCVSEWAETVGVSRNTLNARLSYGWSDERTLTEPVRHITRP
jgi:hypothetical protein